MLMGIQKVVETACMWQICMKSWHLPLRGDRKCEIDEYLTNCSCTKRIVKNLIIRWKNELTNYTGSIIPTHSTSKNFNSNFFYCLYLQLYSLLHINVVLRPN